MADSRNPIGVIGAGLMGHGIAQVFAIADHPVVLIDAQPAAFEAAERKITRNLELMAEYGLRSSSDPGPVLDRIRFSTDLADLSDRSLII